MVDAKPITLPPTLEYSQCIWGDSIYGTKDHIQALGIGVDCAFPREIDGPRRTLKVRDPRGFLATIDSASWRGEGVFHVSIPLFEECPRPVPMVQPYAPGISKREYALFDEYRGAAAALAASGLVRLDQLPGQPGMRKVRVSILPDGSVLGGAPTANCAEMKNPGAKEIERAGIGMFRVSVRVSTEEEEQRRLRDKIARFEWEDRILSLPRPAPLNEERALILARRSHLKLVWSASRPINGDA